MITYLMIFQVCVSLLLIALVLLQFGKGAEAGLMSGGGASEAVFSGSQKGNILSKITIVLIFLFLGNCMLLAKLQSTTSSKSIMDSLTTTEQSKEVPASKPAEPIKPNTATKK